MTATPGGPNDPRAPQNAIPTMITIQQHVAPLITAAGAAANNISAARNGASARNGSGDIALVNGLQHLTDTGIVRQEDIQNQLHGMGLPGTIQGVIQFIQGHGTFNDTQRAQMLAMAERLYAAQNHRLQTQVEAYRPILGQLGDGAYDIVIPRAQRQEFGWEPNPNAPRPTAPRPQPAPPGLHVGSQPRQAPPSGNVGIGASNPGPRVTGRPRRVG